MALGASAIMTSLALHAGRCAGTRSKAPSLRGESTTFLLAALLRLRVAALGATLGCGTGREEAAPGCSERRAVRIGDFGRAPRPHRSLPLGVRWALRGSAAQPPECTAQPAAWRAATGRPEQQGRGIVAARTARAACGRAAASWRRRGRARAGPGAAAAAVRAPARQRRCAEWYSKRPSRY